MVAFYLSRDVEKGGMLGPEGITRGYWVENGVLLSKGYLPLVSASAESSSERVVFSAIRRFSSAIMHIGAPAERTYKLSRPPPQIDQYRVILPFRTRDRCSLAYSR